MNKELKALERIGKRIYGDIPETADVIDDDLSIAEIALKALQIIGKKGVNIYFLKETDNADEYNELIQPHFGMKQLTQEEFDLLKEVLL